MDVVPARYEAAFFRTPAEVVADLQAFADLLRKWQPAQNLVSRETLTALWQRHILDSLQILPLLTDADSNFLDLGSGGGLPALPLAIARKGSGSRFTLVESNGRKASFLRTVARELALPVEVLNCRIEDIDSRGTSIPHVMTSRALAPLPELFATIAPFFGPGTRAILHKGREHVDEIAESRAQWQFDVLVVPSDTNPGSALLVARNLSARIMV